MELILQLFFQFLLNNFRFMEIIYNLVFVSYTIQNFIGSR